MVLPVDSPPGGGGGGGGGTWHPGSGAALYNNGSAVSGFDVSASSFTLNFTADVFIAVFARQGYSAGLKSWGAALIVDGVTIQTAGGAGGYTDCFNMAKALKSLAAGVHSFQFQWHAEDTSVSLNGVSCHIHWCYK